MVLQNPIFWFFDNSLDDVGLNGGHENDNMADVVLSLIVFSVGMILLG